MNNKNNCSGSRFFAPLLGFSIAITSIAIVWVNTLMHPEQLSYGPFHYSDWLINYSGGFIRRGLAGELIQYLTKDGPAIGVINTLVFGIFTVLSLGLAVLLGLTTKRWPIVAIVLMAPGSILTMAISNEFYYHKEVLFHACLVLVALIAMALAAARGKLAKERLFKLLTFFIVLFVLVLPWIHESFIFISLPAQLLVLYFAALHLDKKINRMLFTLVIVSIIIFVITAVFKGTLGLTLTMWDSLSPVDRELINPGQAEVLAGGGIGAIGWTFWKALGDVIDLFVSGYGWYWLLPMVLLAICAWLISSMAIEEKGLDRVAVWQYLDYFLLIFLASLPLYCLGIDWGRWISANFISFVILLLVCLNLEFSGQRGLTGIYDGDALTLRFWRSAPSLLMKYAVPIVLILSFTIKMPECCIFGYSNTILQQLRNFFIAW